MIYCVGVAIGLSVNYFVEIQMKGYRVNLPVFICFCVKVM